MKRKHRSIEQIVDEQVQRWQILHQESAREEREIPVITISREPGSGGRILAELGKNTEAILDLEFALRAFPDRDEIHGTLASL